MARVARQIRLSGVFPAAITPYHPKAREADYSAALELVDFLTAAGVDGICFFDATGEFINYSFAERHRLLSLAVKRSRVPVIAGVSHSTLSGALQLADDAINAGADALLLLPPWFYRYGQAELEQFYRSFARETSDAVPILIDNSPAFSTGLEFDTLRRILETGRFAGVRDATADPAYLDQLLDLRQGLPFAILSGSDLHAATALTRGADGLLSGCACAVPELAVALARAVNASASALAPDVPALALAAQYDARFTEFAQHANRFPWPVAIRRAVELRGQKSGPLAIPLAPATEQALEDFAAWFRQWHAA